MNKIPDGYLPLLEKIQKNLNEEDLKVLQDIFQGRIPDKKIVKKLCIKMTTSLNKWEKIKLGELLFIIRFKNKYEK